jgi:molecular chaperone IbpA
MTNLTLGHAAFHPYHKIGVGFDRVFNELDRLTQLASSAGNNSYPPFNLEKTGDNSYRISIAVAGFSEADLDVTQKENTLTVTGEKREEDKGDYLHKGIATRNFTRQFVLADHVDVKTAGLRDGLLVIDLEKHVPEELKPRKIPLIKE